MEKINDTVRNYAEKVIIDYFQIKNVSKSGIENPVIFSEEIFQELYNAIEKSRNEGCIYKKFITGFIPILNDAGLSNIKEKQLQIIYDVYNCLAYSHYTYKSMKLLADMYPYWRYRQIQRNWKNKAHSKFDDKVFRHDDPIWYYLFPPSDYDCGCSVYSTDKSENVESGAKYMKYLENNKHFKICPVKAWEPDTNKYVTGIKEQLENILKNK